MDTSRLVFPIAGPVVDGLRVRKDVPNTSSIQASLGDYKVLKGVREVSMSYFDGACDTTPRTKALAKQIEASGEINPLIVVRESDQCYVLEGGHRWDALRILGKTSFPALVVLDMDSLDEANWSDPKPEPHALPPTDAPGQEVMELTSRWVTRNCRLAAKITPGGPLQNMGAMQVEFGDTVMHVIPSPDDPSVGFVTGLTGKDISSKIDEMATALKGMGFRDVEYRGDNSDGRGQARERLFQRMLAKFRTASKSLKDILDEKGSLFTVKQMGKSVLVNGIHADTELAEMMGVKVGDLVFEIVNGTDGRKFGSIV